MQRLTIANSELSSYQFPFQQPFTIAGQLLQSRGGFYLTLTASNGMTAQGEAAPLPGLSQETDRRVKHDLDEIRSYLKPLEIPAAKDELLLMLRQEPHLFNACPSVRFAVESALLSLAAQTKEQSLVEFLGGPLHDVSVAALLQGNHNQVSADVKRHLANGYKVFKLKVGDRNIALDVKKVQAVRVMLERDMALRLDANRSWSLKEALIFAELAGLDNIDFIEEPLQDAAQIGKFYQETGMPVALDETLAVLRCGIQAPGRCSPTLADHEAVKVYVLKPTMLGGIIKTMDWMQEAKNLGKRAIISSSFESPVGLKVLANLACLTSEAAGLGTEQWFKDVRPLANEQGIIKKELLSK